MVVIVERAGCVEHLLVYFCISRFFHQIAHLSLVESPVMHRRVSQGEKSLFAFLRTENHYVRRIHRYCHLYLVLVRLISRAEFDRFVGSEDIVVLKLDRILQLELVLHFWLLLLLKLVRVTVLCDQVAKPTMVKRLALEVIERVIHLTWEEIDHLISWLLLHMIVKHCLHDF